MAQQPENVLEILKHISNNQDKLMQTTARLLEAQQRDSSPPTIAEKKSRIPLDVKRNVRVTVHNLPTKWDYTQSFRAPRNELVNKNITKNIRALENMHKVDGHLMQRALKAHFLGKRRQEKAKQNGSHNAIKQRERRRHRINEKLHLRKMTTETSSTYTEQMKRKIRSSLVYEAMSPEISAYETDSEEEMDGSDDEENWPKKKIIKTFPLSWRSRELNEVLQSLDRKIMRKKSERARAMVIDRLEGAPIERSAPEKMPAWTVKKKQ